MKCKVIEGLQCDRCGRLVRKRWVWSYRCGIACLGELNSVFMVWKNSQWKIRNYDQRRKRDIPAFYNPVYSGLSKFYRQCARGRK